MKWLNQHHWYADTKIENWHIGIGIYIYIYIYIYIIYHPRFPTFNIQIPMLLLFAAHSEFSLACWTSSVVTDSMESVRWLGDLYEHWFSSWKL